jgi:hypothetical protein
MAWVLNQLFWQQLFPVASGIVSQATVKTIREEVLPRTASPFITEHLLRTETIDGAVIAGLLPNKAWAKYAIPKGLPTNGQRTLAIENEPHEVNDFDGEIKDGYGKGTKTLLLSDNAIVKVEGRTSVQKLNYHIHDADRAGRHYDLVVTGVKPGTKQWELNIVRGDLKGRYAFVTTAKGILVTPMVDRGIRIPKPNYTLRQEPLLEQLDPSQVVIERKIDGSLGNAAIDDFRATFRSHRDGGETYYDKLPAVEWIKNESPFFTSRWIYPGPKISGTVFQGELVHPEGAARVSGILNSLAPNARAIQRQRGTVSYYVWDIVKLRGRDVSKLPYEQRRQLYRQLVREIRTVNKSWHCVDEMGSDETPKSFYDRVTKDPLPWGEGVVIKWRNEAASDWDKIKMAGFGYFKLVDIIEGDGKYAGSVGRILVENPTNGARGEVGSLSIPDEFRQWIWDNRDFLIGQTVKVRSQEITQRGVPRAGVLYGFHDSEVDLLMTAEASVAGTGRDPKSVVYAMKSAAGWKRK